MGIARALTLSPHRDSSFIGTSLLWCVDPLVAVLRLQVVRRPDALLGTAAPSVGYRLEELTSTPISLKITTQAPRLPSQDAALEGAYAFIGTADLRR